MANGDRYQCAKIRHHASRLHAYKVHVMELKATSLKQIPKRVHKKVLHKQPGPGVHVYKSFQWYLKDLFLNLWQKIRVSKILHPAPLKRGFFLNATLIWFYNNGTRPPPPHSQLPTEHQTITLYRRLQIFYF